MREPLVPRPHHAELLGRVLGRHAGHRVPRPVGVPAAPPLQGRGAVGELLEPHLADPLGPPGREHARAVAGRQDRREPVGHPRVGHAVDDALGDGEAGDDVESHRDHDAEPSEGHDRSVEPGVAALEAGELPGAEQQHDRAHARGQGLVAHPGSVGARRAGAGDRDVGEGPGVGKRPPRPVQSRREGAVGPLAGDVDHPPVGVDLEGARERGQGHEQTVGVRDRAEGVAGPQGAHPRGGLDQPSQVVEVRGAFLTGRPEGHVAGPVRGAHEACADPARGRGHRQAPGRRTARRPRAPRHRCPTC